MEDLQQTEKNVRAHEQTYKVGMNDNADSSHISDSELGDTLLPILEQVRNAKIVISRAFSSRFTCGAKR